MAIKPFLYFLTRDGEDKEDLHFTRVRGGKVPSQPNVWAMHMDIEDPANLGSFI